MKILVTGGAGFIGSNFIIQQIKSTDNVILNFDKLTYAGNKSNLSCIEHSKNYKFIEGDIVDSELVWETISSFLPDAICVIIVGIIARLDCLGPYVLKGLTIAIGRSYVLKYE